MLAGNTLLRPLVNWVNRRPISAGRDRGAVPRACGLPTRRDVSAVRDLLDESWKRAGYPLREIETLSESEEQVELAAVLVPTTAEPAALERVVATLEAAAAGAQRDLDGQHHQLTRIAGGARLLDSSPRTRGRPQ